MHNSGDLDRQLGRSVARGAVWTLLIRGVNRSLGVVSTLMLARLLSPQDFGIYALAMMVYSFVELLRAFGFATVLIQNQRATDKHYHTAWTMHLLLSVATASLLFLIAPIVAGWLGEDRLVSAVRFLALLFLIDGLKNIGIVDFQKNLRFDKEFRLSVSVKVVGFCFTVSLALMLGSYWAMLWGLFASSLVMLVLSYRMHPFRPTLCLEHWRDLMSFGAWLQVNNIVKFLNNHVEKIVVSRYLGVGAVGSLTVAREIGSLIAEVTQPIHRAAYPGYARVNHDPQRVVVLFLDVLAMLLLLGVPVAAGIYALSDLFVPVVLGSKWIDISGLVAWLAIASVFRVLMASVNNVVIAMGRPKLATMVTATRLVIFTVLLIILVQDFGLMAVGYAATGSLAAILMVSFLSVRLVLGLRLVQIVRVGFRPIASAAIMAFGVMFIVPAYDPSPGVFWVNLSGLLTGMVVGAMIYSICIYALWRLQGSPQGAESRLLAEFMLRTRLLAERLGA